MSKESFKLFMLIWLCCLMSFLSGVLVSEMYNQSKVTAPTIEVVCTSEVQEIVESLAQEVSDYSEVVESETIDSIEIEETFSRSETDKIEEEVIEEFVGVLRPCGYSAEELEKGLLYNLKPLASVYLDAEEETGINAVFLASVSALESGWARTELSSSHNNLFGWTLDSGFKFYNSKEDSIREVARSLKSMYLTEGGKYFNGYEVEDINVRYNGSSHWENLVNQIMNEIEQRIESEG